ncbi:hypothetical protein SAMN05192529_108164 [Arachidicoccus rhizosphaerae]|uniref:Uncharacterized protein n=1 Tax=Arachidicoccus rhizosphaerae TaxID=551991 RepID=A0A1H3YNB7_9BACT|nr:hypothetical protein [Arachidicoccus rhizosphaerae]SEA12504.1 hypothetical protein SAMN05192529_108164 [Arachidicoccus rhizosphaerae]
MDSLDTSSGTSRDLKQQFEKVVNSNVYCWLALLICIIGAILEFYFHEGTRYSDKFFLVLAIFVIGILINGNQLRKNYVKKKEKK